MAIDGLAFDAGRFHWSSARVAPPYSVVLLGPDYRRLTRVDGIAEAWWFLQPDLLEGVASGETCHALVLGGEEPDTRMSPLIDFARP